jgi:hypothetical protein
LNFGGDDDLASPLSSLRVRYGGFDKEGFVKIDDQTIEILRNIQTEIGAGMVLFPRTPEERAHNNACDRANTIISNYQQGFGLFQMKRAPTVEKSQPEVPRNSGEAKK